MNLHAALLILVTLVWGTTFPLLKSATQHLSGLEVSVLRFMAAGLCLSPFAFRLSRAAWRDGTILGVLGLISYVSQAYGLQFISSNRSAFLTSLNVLFVPLMALALGAKLTPNVVIASVVACFGIGLMSWDGGGNWAGDGATVISALAYASYVLFLSRVSKQHSAIVLAATQIIMMALIGTVGLAFEGSAQISSLPTRLGQVWPVVLYLGLVATAGMLFLQAIGQRKVSAAKAALIFALEPAFAALFSWLWLGEQLTLRTAIGGTLLVAAVVMSEWKSEL